MARPKEFDIDQVLDRATELFWTKGYEETSMRDLEEGLGVGRQSLYSTFGDKRDLFLAALDRYASLQRERIAPLLAAGRRPRPQSGPYFDEHVQPGRLLRAAPLLHDAQQCGGVRAGRP